MAKVFFSYSHKDEALRDQLETHLAQLRNQGLIDSWHDRRILAGEEFGEAIAESLDTAEIILLLVSSDFLASKYCYSIEMAKAMERHEAGHARVIPVILRDCDWHTAPFGKLTALPADGKPIRSWPDIDQAFAAVAREVRKAVEAKSSPRGRAVAAGAPSPARAAHGSAARSAPAVRSSNLRVKKTFTEHDKDEFLREAFEHLARFFAASLAALEERNGDIRTTFDRIDSRRFSAAVYRQGKLVSECSVRLDGLGRSNAIAFSFDASARSGSFNEMLSVEADDQHLYFKPMGLQFGGRVAEGKLSDEGAAEFLWSMLLGRLQ